MKLIVQFSGGKDSQAVLIHTVQKYGSGKVVAVFQDTGFEHQKTYNHINKCCDDLSVELVVNKSKKYEGMFDLAKQKKRFPSSYARFCTTHLKIYPFIDYLLDEVQQSVIIFQGIRKNESLARSKMNSECRLFKYYIDPYGKDNRGNNRFHNYRKKEVLKFLENYGDDIIRPVFDWSGNDVMDFILKNGQKPNPLYYEGFSRVGCFPCVQCGLSELNIVRKNYPERFKEIEDFELHTGLSFAQPDKIPDRYQTGISKRGVSFPLIKDVGRYLADRDSTGNLFSSDPEFQSCMSIYNICE